MPRSAEIGGFNIVQIRPPIQTFSLRVKIKRSPRLIFARSTDLIMPFIDRSNSVPLRPFDTVRACHKANSTVSRIFVTGEETDEPFTFDMPGLHIREIGHWNFLAVFDFCCIYQFKLAYIVWFPASVDIRRPGRTM
ncbi:hypothetical protein ES703_122096 [subsurface metagenome]